MEALSLMAVLDERGCFASLDDGRLPHTSDSLEHSYFDELSVGSLAGPKFINVLIVMWEDTLHVEFVLYVVVFDGDYVVLFYGNCTFYLRFWVRLFIVSSRWLSFLSDIKY